MKKNILLVDDDRATNFINEKAVRLIPFIKDVSAVTNGYEALQFFNGTRSSVIPDIVLLDLNMPIMGGLEFLQAFHDLDIPNKERILFIIITSYDERDNINRARSFGIKHFLVKPVSAEMIKSTILEEFRVEV